MTLRQPYPTHLGVSSGAWGPMTQREPTTGVGEGLVLERGFFRYELIALRPQLGVPSSNQMQSDRIQLLPPSSACKSGRVRTGTLLSQSGGLSQTHVSVGAARSQWVLLQCPTVPDQYCLAQGSPDLVPGLT